MMLATAHLNGENDDLEEQEVLLERPLPPAHGLPQTWETRYNALSVSYQQCVPAIIATLTTLQWWFFNVAVIVINKWIYQEYLFQFPMTLTCVHFLLSWAGAYLSIHVFKLTPLIEVRAEDRLPRIMPLAAITGFNIVLGNVSLRYIPVSFMQTIKALTPATTVLLQVLVWRREFATPIYLSLLPVVGGIMLSSITELSFVLAGFVAALLSCFVTSTGVILAELLLNGKYKLDSINTVYHMIPYSLQFLVIPAAIVEGRGVYLWFLTTDPIVRIWAMGALVLSGVLAFFLNFSLYAVIKVTGAVTFCVVGNLKVAAAILISWLIFRNPMNLLNILGCSITVIGCTYYGFVQNYYNQQEKSQREKAPGSLSPNQKATPELENVSPVLTRRLNSSDSISEETLKSPGGPRSPPSS